MSKKKYKLKHKKSILICIILLIILAIGGFFIYKKLSNDKAIKTLKANYNQYIITNKKANLYDKKHNKIGTISSGYYLELTKISNLTLKNKYLQINNTPYYLSYKDIKKTEQRKEKEIEKDNNSYYLDLNKKLITNKKISLLKDKKKVVTLNKLTTDIRSIDDNYYYINFLGEDLKVKKTKSIKIQNGKETKDNSYITTIVYDKISDNCSEDTCFHPNSIKAHINRLQKEGYYFITGDDYIRYLKGYVNLKDKAVALYTKESNDFTKQIEDELKVKINSTNNLKFTNNNKKTTRNDKLDNINNYYPKKYMIIDEYLKMAEGQDVTDNGQGDIATAIPVVNYHFFYDASTETCNESICLSTQKFEEQLKWLQENNYKTLTINEFVDWKEGYIELPSKSVLLTVDDGAMGTGKHNGNKLIPLLEKYKQHATLFLITGWWEISNYQSPYLDIQSHTHDLHYEAQCADGRGKVACSDYNTVKNDLTNSLTVLNGDKTSFCFPFYSYDKESLQVLDDLGFRVAFIGGNARATRSQKNHLVTRYPILSDITLQRFINIVK